MVHLFFPLFCKAHAYPSLARAPSPAPFRSVSGRGGPTEMRRKRAACSDDSSSNTPISCLVRVGTLARLDGFLDRVAVEYVKPKLKKYK